MENLLENLNPEQLKAVTHGKGPLMIVAGAGTGKTTVITQRIAWLIEQGHAKPEQILALTFTDKAAGEMEERVDMLLPMGYVDLQISTFHAFCEKLLRQYGAEIGLSRDFRLMTELDTWLLVRHSFDELPLEYFRPMGNPTKYLRGLLSHFSRAKDEGITPDMYLKFAEEQTADQDSATSSDDAFGDPARTDELARAYAAYQKILANADALDFGDLLMFSLKLLKERPAVLKAVRAQYTWMLVDEFQDTNKVQYELVKLIAAPANNLTIVGDDDQAIYRFRGASIANILEFETDYPKAKKIVLTRNYRSVQAVLDAAHTFIQANNPRRLEHQNPKLVKKLSSHREGEGAIEHLHGKTAADEVSLVVRKIRALKETYNCSWNDFAILVRANDAALGFVAGLEDAKIPYQFLALRGLYSKPVVLDMLSWLHAIDNPFESPSVYRALTLPTTGLSHHAIAEVTHLANRKGKSLIEACRMVYSGTGLDQEAFDRLQGFLRLLDHFRVEATKRRTSELFVMVVRETGYVDWINKQSERVKSEAFGYLQSLLARIKTFEERVDDPSLRHFLAEFQVERDAGGEGSLTPDMEAGPEMVRIMTVHGSKGLEFRFVFVVNMVDRRFPAQARSEAIPLPEGLISAAEKEGEWHLEEERRLMYVAMTRAKDALYFTSADDYGGARARKLSRFLTEMGYEKPDVPEEAITDPFQEDGRPLIEETAAGVVLHLPKQFSFSQLVAFRTCPLQYKFAHILKIPVFGKWTFSFGKTMHNTLQRFFVVWTERVGAVQGNLFAEAVETDSGKLPVSLEELLEMYADCWQDDWYRDDKERAEYRKEGKESLTAYYRMIEQNRPDPMFLEQPFTLKIGDVVLKGRIDRIDRCEGGIEIIDYKTGTPKEKLSKEEKEQLYLYQIAAKDVLGLNPVKLTFHYLKDNSRVSFIAEDDELIELRESVVSRVRSIRQGVYPPTPGFHCQFCDFADICEFREK